MPAAITTGWTELSVAGTGRLTIVPGAGGRVRVESSTDGTNWSLFGIFDRTTTLGVPDSAIRLRAIGLGAAGTFDVVTPTSSATIRSRVLATALAARSAGNSTDSPPWNPVQPWRANTTYVAGTYVSKGGSVYRMFSGTGGQQANGVSGATWNNNSTSTAPQTDNTCIWLYIGPDVTQAADFTLSGVAIAGTAGQFTCTAASRRIQIGMRLTISGTFGGTGSITGYADPTDYSVVETNGSTSFTLRAIGGAAIVTTAGTPTGLTYTVGASADRSAPTATFISLLTTTITGAMGLSQVTIDLNDTALLSTINNILNVGASVLGPDPSFPAALQFLGPPSAGPTSTRLTNSIGNWFEFETDADVVAIHARSTWTLATDNNILVQVNGRWMYAGPEGANNFRPPGDLAGSGGAFPTVLVDLSSLPRGAFKRVRVFARNYTRACRFIYVKPGYTIRKPASPQPWKVAVEGDSLTQGTNGASLHPYGYSHSQVIADLLGASEFYMSAVGGTGYTTNGGSLTTYADRLAQIIPFAPDCIIVASCHNGTVTTQSIIDYVRLVKAALPNCWVIICGSALLQGESSTSGVVFNNEVAAMAAASAFAGDPLVSFIPVLTAAPTPLLIDNGTGNGASPTGGGVGDRFFWVGGSVTDSHPHWGGYEAYARMLVSGIVRAAAT